MSIWEWTTQSDTPVCQASLGDDYSYQTYLTFHHEDSHQLVSNSEDLVVFYQWVRELLVTKVLISGGSGQISGDSIEIPYQSRLCLLA